MKYTKENPCPSGEGVARSPPTDAGTTLLKEYLFPVWKSQTPGIPVLPTLESKSQENKVSVISSSNKSYLAKLAY